MSPAKAIQSGSLTSGNRGGKLTSGRDLNGGKGGLVRALPLSAN